MREGERESTSERVRKSGGDGPRTRPAQNNASRTEQNIVERTPHDARLVSSSACSPPVSPFWRLHTHTHTATTTAITYQSIRVPKRPTLLPGFIDGQPAIHPSKSPSKARPGRRRQRRATLARSKREREKAAAATLRPQTGRCVPKFLVRYSIRSVVISCLLHVSVLFVT